jgi:hypothetical protein
MRIKKYQNRDYKQDQMNKERLLAKDKVTYYRSNNQEILPEHIVPHHVSQNLP